MDPSEFLVQCTVLLERDQTTEVLQLLKDEEYKVEFQFSSFVFMVILVLKFQHLIKIAFAAFI